MAAITYACSECGALLRSPQVLPAGKKIRCPKCNEVFTIGDGPAGNGPAAPTPKPAAATKAKPAPTPDEDEDDGGSYGFAQMETVIAPTDAELSGKKKPVDDDDEDDDLDDERPVKKKKKRFKEKKQSSGSGKTVALIICSVLLVLLLAGGGVGAYMYLNWYKNKGTGKEDPLALLPADCNMVGHLNYGAISNQPAVADLVEELWKGLSSSGVFQRIKTETGIEPKDLMDQVYVGMNFPID
ncbi:MAG TPA: hypothetical protein VGP68_01310, partial [Gemmataceae bacterium]|nr:hypothetical protein [Gemmataceae bacterium]